MFYVAHLSGWDMILGKLGLQNVRATISVGAAPVTIQPPGMDRFPLHMWRGNLVTDQKSDLSTAATPSLPERMSLHPELRNWKISSTQSRNSQHYSQMKYQGNYHLCETLLTRLTSFQVVLDTNQSTIRT